MTSFAVTILVRLADGFTPEGSQWLDWRVQRERMTRGDGLFKAYLSNPYYFAPAVKQTLFPDQDSRNEDRWGGRWVRQPLAEQLELGRKRKSELVLAVDLLEVVQASLSPGITYGLAHLSARPPDADLDLMLLTAKLLGKAYRRTSGSDPLYIISRPGGRIALTGHWPHLDLADELFGAGHHVGARQAHIMIVARVPDSADVDDGTLRRALARGKSLTDAKADLAGTELQQRDAERTHSIGAATVGFFGLSTAITHRDDPSEWLFNARTYWFEAILFSFLQQSYLEYYAGELARLGPSPFGDRIDTLFEEWVAFLNVLWWRELSFTRDVPGRILDHVHVQRGTSLLHADIEKAFATYVEGRRHRTENSERRALRGLQTYGAGFAVVSAAAGVAQVADVSYVNDHPARLLAAIIALGPMAWWFTRRRLGDE